MPSEDQTLINGKYYARGNVVLKIDGVRYKEVTTIKYGAKRVRGNAVRVLDEANSIASYLAGQVEYDPIMIGLRKEAKLLLKQKLKARSSTGSPCDAEVPITISYNMPGKAPIVVDAAKCFFNDGASEVGDDATAAITDEVEFVTTKIKENGIDLEPAVAA